MRISGGFWWIRRQGKALDAPAACRVIMDYIARDAGIFPGISDVAF